MASNIKTPNLNLSQWELSDKPGMEDFNRDNLLLDAEVAKLYNALNQANKKMEALEQSLASKMDGSGAITAPFISDSSISANDTTLPFSYFASTEQGIPTNYCFVITMRHGDDRVQYATAVASGNTYIRNKHKPKDWSAWQRVTFA